MERKVKIIGAGLAGVEAAYYLSKAGIEVDLYEQRPVKSTGAHHTDLFGELVCSNSLKSFRLDNACGLLKEEMRHMGSLTMEVAEMTKVPAGNALSVDREQFAQMLTERILSLPNVHVHREEVKEFADDDWVIVASGPLTSPDLLSFLEKKTGEKMFSFFDACSPIVELQSVDMTKAYFKSRYEQGDDSYLNCAMNQEQYEKFYDALIHAERALTHEMDTHYFEGCMPIEVMAERGEKTLRYGPLKPMGLRRTPEDRPYAVVQLRQDNVAGNLYNIVGFQTNLTYAEQKRVFSLIPGLEHAEYVRFGLMHRNTYICAPKHLSNDLSLKVLPNCFIAGQLSGVEGYVESACFGILAAYFIEKKMKGETVSLPPLDTMCGSLLHYLSFCTPSMFAPMNANFGILYGAKKDKMETSKQALLSLDTWWRMAHGG